MPTDCRYNDAGKEDGAMKFFMTMIAVLK